MACQHKHSRCHDKADLANVMLKQTLWMSCEGRPHGCDAKIDLVEVMLRHTWPIAS